MTRPNYRTELHTHSYYSLLDGLPSPTEIIKNAVSKGMKSIALTDHGFLGGMAEFFLQAKKNNIKPIYGIEFYETSNVLSKDKDNRYYHLLILCKNNNGMRELNKVVKRSTQEENFYYKPRIEIDWLKPFADDIVVSTACLNGRINKIDRKEKIEFVNYMKSIFKNFYIELQSHETEDQIACNKELLEVSKLTNTPIVITCDAHML
ncbi:MAG: PHP domain-containing protein, partial [Bacilli bacterium]|nr:PHP domain-containing protein [Bacilli bacterium]